MDRICQVLACFFILWSFLLHHETWDSADQRVSLKFPFSFLERKMLFWCFVCICNKHILISLFPKHTNSSLLAAKQPYKKFTSTVITWKDAKSIKGGLRQWQCHVMYVRKQNVQKFLNQVTKDTWKLSNKKTTITSKAHVIIAQESERPFLFSMMQ